MRIEHYSKEKLKREITHIVRTYLGAEYRIFFFGSRVSGGGNERSDIDIGIEGPAKVPRHTLARIKEDIAGLPLLYSVDIVDFKNVSRDFERVARAHTEVIM